MTDDLFDNDRLDAYLVSIAYVAMLAINGCVRPNPFR